MATATATPTATPTARAVTDCYADCNPPLSTPTPTATPKPHPTPRPYRRPPPTPTSAATPTAPRALHGTNVTTSSFTANWRSVSGATGYRLDVSITKSFSSYVPGYQNLDVGNTTSYNVTGLSPNTTYFYRLRAYNDNGTSPKSNVIRVKTRRP